MNPHTFQSFGEQCMICGNGFYHPLHMASAASEMPKEAPLTPKAGKAPSGLAGEATEPWRKPVEPELEAALGRLKLEMIHFRSTGIGKDFLRKELENVLAKLNIAAPALSQEP